MGSFVSATSWASDVCLASEGPLRPAALKPGVSEGNVPDAYAAFDAADVPAMAAAVAEVGRLSRALVVASMDAAQRSGRQRGHVMDVVRLEQEIREAARRSAARSHAAADQTLAVARDIEVGSERIAGSNRSMAEMVKTVTEGAELMEEFVSRMVEVNRMVTEISGIARQTKLLALNAAIEAAHAGREGDGFNVIAREIRQLADRAGRSTTEINEKIEAMTKSAKAAGGAMQVGRAAAEASIEENLGVQGAFSNIRESMEGVQRISSEVAAEAGRTILDGERVETELMRVDELAGSLSLDADAAAEMSIRMVGCAIAMNQRLGVSSAGGASPGAHSVHGEDEVGGLLRQVEVEQARVLDAMTLLGAETGRMGSPSLCGSVEVKQQRLPGLRFGSVPAAEGTPWVDRIFARTGCGSTIFVREGECFMRLATNVKLPNGERATGTALNPKGLAMEQLRKGKAYFGAVYVLGKPYVAAYEPVLSAAGQVIGALYVGRPLERSG